MSEKKVLEEQKRLDYTEIYGHPHTWESKLVLQSRLNKPRIFLNSLA